MQANINIPYFLMKVIDINVTLRCMMDIPGGGGWNIRYKSLESWLVSAPGH
jgi:hypothetical protein